MCQSAGQLREQGLYAQSEKTAQAGPGAPQSRPLRQDVSADALRLVAVLNNYAVRYKAVAKLQRALSTTLSHNHVEVQSAVP